MLSLGAFAFAAPGMLALLLALPLIYWLLRMIPPLPKLIRGGCCCCACCWPPR